MYAITLFHSTIATMNYVLGLDFKDFCRVSSIMLPINFTREYVCGFHKKNKLSEVQTIENFQILLSLFLIRYVKSSYSVQLTMVAKREPNWKKELFIIFLTLAAKA